MEMLRLYLLSQIELERARPTFLSTLFSEAQSFPHNGSLGKGLAGWHAVYFAAAPQSSMSSAICSVNYSKHLYSAKLKGRPQASTHPERIGLHHLREQGWV